MRVQMIRGALSVGFSVRELEQIFTVRDQGGAPCQQVRRLGIEKLHLVETQIKDLQFKRHELKKTLAKWERLLKQASHGKRAGLLEVFTRSKEKST